METLYRELKSLKKEVETVKQALIPVERVSARELRELQRIKREMGSGKEKTWGKIFAE